jgi:hypothetical protein
MVNSDTYRVYHEWVCDDRSIVEILGEPMTTHSDGSVMYYNYGGSIRLMVDINVDDSHNLTHES